MIDATVKFAGTGQTVYVGHPDDDQPESPAHAELTGPGADNDFTLEPPTVEQGEGAVAVSVIDVRLVDSAGLSTDSLFISKWPGAFTQSGPNPPLNPGFVDADPHRFRIRVSNLPGGGAGVPAFLSTMHEGSSDWDDDETEITLHPTSPGTWLSETLILVSNAIDDQETHTNAHLRISAGPDNTLDDRTHIARLGSQVHARFSLLGAECRAPVVSASAEQAVSAGSAVGGEGAGEDRGCGDAEGDRINLAGRRTGSTRTHGRVAEPAGEVVAPGGHQRAGG